MTRPIFVPNPHVRLDRPFAAPYVPLELLSAMAVAEEAGASPALFDVNRLVEHGRLTVGPGLWSRAAELLVEAEPDLLLLETWTGTLHGTLCLVEAARALLPRTPFVLVGAGTSALAAEVLLRYAEIDGVIRGEPEPAVAVLAAGADRRLPAAPGLARRTAAGLDVPALAAVEDLETLPRPAYHLALLQPGDTIPLEPGRGCPVGCSFCALAGHWVARHRPRRPERLADEMLALAARFPGSVLDLTQDPVYFSDLDRVRLLCARLASAQAPPRWTCHARVDRLDEEALRAMAGAGCSGVLFGVESGCAEQQRRIGKHVDLSRLEPTLAAAKRAGIEARASFILGFPDEDAAALEATALALLRAREAGAAAAPVQVLRAYPGSPLHRDRAATLVLEPLLCTAAPSDERGRELISADPALLSASYLVPGRLPRGRLLAAWLALSRLADPLAALLRAGVPLAELLGIEVPAAVVDLDEAVELVAGQLVELARRVEAVDVIALEDLLAYHLALGGVSREAAPDPCAVEVEALSLLRSQPIRVKPYAAAPWRLLRLRRDLEALLEGELASGVHPATVLLAKVISTGEPSFYTRRSFAVETFTLDEVGAALLPLCSGERDLLTIAHTLSARLRLPPRRAIEACVEIVETLVEAGVLGLAVEATAT